ncbi:hypothetical protein [Kitasatospora setae]|uniref:hypothetical protein n=1 Tax=Kitasatospora setae TaxID=2066 RepID=UPI0012FEE7AD|nr:hypothetical protein [Kitasatospora setae]
MEDEVLEAAGVQHGVGDEFGDQQDDVVGAGPRPVVQGAAGELPRAGDRPGPPVQGQAPSLAARRQRQHGAAQAVVEGLAGCGHSVGPSS